MEAKINIAEILKDKPQGTKLYSSACGKCNLEKVYDKSFKISFYNSKFGFMNGGEGYLDKNGKLYDDGECVVFPSKEMRDWSKFAWKKGDVLVSNDSDSHIIFKGFSKDDYTIFEGKHWISVSKKRHISCLNMQNTQNYHIEDNKEVAQTYIKTIEERLGGKLNLETLEVEKHQTEFKDGDIVVYGESVAICRKIYKDTLYFYVSINDVFGLLFNEHVVSSEGYRFATDEDKQRLFEALEKENKAWDNKKKEVVDLKPKWTPKPFDRVITRTPDTPWTANFFSHIDSDGVKNCIDDKYLMCLPYNEETAKLIGTTNNWEG
jgi:hypothetical protein